jgi:hypothetical protein
VIAVLELLIILCTVGEDNVIYIFTAWLHFADQESQKPLESLVELLSTTKDNEIRTYVISLANGMINFSSCEDLMVEIIGHLEDFKFGDLCKVSLRFF